MMPKKLPGDIKPAVERASVAGFAVAGEQTELMDRLTKVLDELRAAGSVVVVGGSDVAAWSQSGGWFRDLNDGWSQAGGWVQTNDRGPGARVRPPELERPELGRDVLGEKLQGGIRREIEPGAVGRVVVKKPTNRG